MRERGERCRRCECMAIYFIRWHRGSLLGDCFDLVQVVGTLDGYILRSSVGCEYNIPWLPLSRDWISTWLFYKWYGNRRKLRTIFFSWGGCSQYSPLCVVARLLFLAANEMCLWQAEIALRLYLLSPSLLCHNRHTCSRYQCPSHDIICCCCYCLIESANTPLPFIL